jgi:hypothetical protein
MNFQSSPRRGLAYSNLNGNGDAPSRASIGAKWPAKLINSIRHAARPWSAASPKTQDEPIRAELFSIERLEQHAETLAAAQSTTSKPTTNRRLAKRLRDNDGALRAAYRGAHDNACSALDDG